MINTLINYPQGSNNALIATNSPSPQLALSMSVRQSAQATAWCGGAWKECRGKWSQGGAKSSAGGKSGWWEPNSSKGGWWQPHGGSGKKPRNGGSWQQGAGGWWAKDKPGRWVSYGAAPSQSSWDLSALGEPQEVAAANVALLETLLAQISENTFLDDVRSRIQLELEQARKHAVDKRSDAKKLLDKETGMAK